MPSTLGLHHLNKRKRIHEKHEVYPHPNWSIRMLDRFIYIVGILGPMTAIPQILLIFGEQQAQGVSALSWTLSTCSSLTWFIYSVVHREKPLIISSGLWVIMQSIIVIGVLL